MGNTLENNFTKLKLDFQETSAVQKTQEFAAGMIENHRRNALAAHFKNRVLLFAVGEPFYTELKEEGMYKKELPNGETHIVKCHFAADGTITDEIVNNCH